MENNHDLLRVLTREQLESVRKELLTRTAEEYRDSSRARNQLVAGLS